MEENRLQGIGGWLLVYLVGSIPPLMVYSMGLSGWFLEYPAWLMVVIFLALATPLALVLLRSPRAPRWNIAALWIMAGLMILRAAGVFVLPAGGAGEPPRGEDLPAVVGALSGIVAFALGWAAVWTGYFMRSARVRNTFV